MTAPIIIRSLHRRRRGDPLGAGNTKLIADLGVTPLIFRDVRQNLTVTGGAVSSLADVKGDGTYGPAVVANTSTNPTWDGTTLNFAGLGGLVAASAWLDTSQHFTAAYIVDISTSGSGGLPVAQFGPATNGTPWIKLSPWPSPAEPRFYSSTGASAFSSAPTGSGNLELVILEVTPGGVSQQTLAIEVPSKGKVTSALQALPPSTLFPDSLGAMPATFGSATFRFRAQLVWSGGYTTTQRDRLATWAATYHSAVLA